MSESSEVMLCCEGKKKWDSKLFNSVCQLMRYFSSYITCIDKLISDKLSMQSNWGGECFQKTLKRLFLISSQRCQLVTVSVSASASVSVFAVRALIWASVCASLYAFVSSLELLRSLMFVSHIVLWAVVFSLYQIFCDYFMISVFWMFCSLTKELFYLVVIKVTVNCHCWWVI